ncbi:DUF4189 domain-containing protein [Dyella sp.]|uniref:DUF4189 domain-containing protein n=1 Tax=Dyella sp. TaxID=1869338 RepID=UPI002B489614|nr:DUF4189 domain-containing protein [Dyella sp.]HKT29208.1 DUF4189 domain-containing protein [Dyella sp.]
MKLFVLMPLLLCLLMFHSFAHAEGGCPPGMIPYSGTDISSCGPLPSGYYQQPSQAPSPRWESRWGAIAIGSVGRIGVATNEPSKRQAEQSAIADCQAKEGKNCKIETLYANGCAVVVAGKKIHVSHSGATLTEATEQAMKICVASDTDCRTIFTSCSLPAQIG